ncbi:cytochrome P450 [Tanacetum coccineum]|uniref:Cytochrome P450 n=1 Tax=Tanacetum coccineum TaxID=301880 RepID=A0ABQ4WRP6_9ASTR
MDNQHGDGGSSEWTWVFNKRNKRHRPQSTTTTNANTHTFHNSESTKKPQPITYYFTNFPSNWNHSTMFEVFKRYGHVDDVFIAGKRNVQGKRFGFATFMGVHNPTAFEKELSTICIGTQKLRCYIAKYQRNLGGLGNPHRHTTPSRVISPRPSFAAVLSRVNPNHQSQKQANLKATTTRTTLHNLPPPPPSPFPTSSAIVLELKSIDGAANTHNIFLDEGFERLCIFCVIMSYNDMFI